MPGPLQSLTTRQFSETLDAWKLIIMLFMLFSPSPGCLRSRQLTQLRSFVFFTGPLKRVPQSIPIPYSLTRQQDSNGTNIWSVPLPLLPALAHAGGHQLRAVSHFTHQQAGATTSQPIKHAHSDDVTAILKLTSMYISQHQKAMMTSS